MTNEQQQQLIELRAKAKLLPAEKATLKNLERLEKKEQSKPATNNVFATKPTTKIQPLPIRFSKAERTGLSELGKDLKRNNLALIIEELGSENEINETKLIRAAILLMKERSQEEIINAIKEVKLNMIR